MTMNKEALVSGLVGVVIGVILTWLFAPTWGGMVGYRNSMMGPGYNTTGKIR